MTDPRCSRKITGELVRIRAVVTVRIALNSLSQWKIPGLARKAMAGDEGEDSAGSRAAEDSEPPRNMLGPWPDSLLPGKGGGPLARRRHSRVKLDFRLLGCLPHPRESLRQRFHEIGRDQRWLARGFTGHVSCQAVQIHRAGH